MKNILFITSNRLGDAVLSTGVVAHLMNEYPNCKITVACGPLATSLFEGCPNVSNIVSLKKEKRAGHWIKLWRQCFLKNWDIIVDLRNSAVSRLLIARKKYIYGPHIDKSMHKVQQNAAVLTLSSPVPPQLWPSEEQQKVADTFINNKDKVIGVGPAANWIGKTWPSDRFIAILKELTAKEAKFANAKIAVFGAPGEESTCYEVLNAFPKKHQIDVIAKCDPGTAAAILARCDLYIGNDSGLMHCAAAAGIPTFGLFGPSYPHLYAPWGDHTDYAQTVETFDELIDFDGYHPETLTKTLMISLSVEDVIKKLDTFLKSR